MSKFTIADLGKGGHGWVLTNDLLGPYYVAEITIDGELNQFSGTNTEELPDNMTLMPRWIVSIHMKSGGVETTRCKEMFANTIVYPSRAEAEKHLKETHRTFLEAKNKYLGKTDDKQQGTDWKQVRINASISILNSLLETTPHSVAEEVVINDIYAKTAIAYADTLIRELKKSEDSFEKLLEL